MKIRLAVLAILLVLNVKVCAQLYNCTEVGTYPSDFTEKCTLDIGNHQCNKSTHCVDNTTTKYTYCTVVKECLIQTPEVHIRCNTKGYSELGSDSTKPVHTELTDTCKTTSLATGNSKIKVCRTNSIKGKLHTECETGS